MKKENGMIMTPRSLKEAIFKDVNIDIDHYNGPKHDNILIGNKFSWWTNLKLSFDNFLLRRRKK
jgi:hypothetical protein